MAENRQRREKRRKIGFGYFLLAILAVGIVAFIIFRVSARSRLNERLAEIRAEGYPVTLRELDDWYAIPVDAENAADFIMDAL